MKKTVRDLWRQGVETLKNFPLASLEARLLLQKAIGHDEKAFFLEIDAPVSVACRRRYESLLKRRLARYPLALLMEEKEFWSLTLRVKKGVFIPRPETESLVELALEISWPRNGIAVDIGTGCGAIALALARERPAATIVATDISARAISLARENALRLGISNFILRKGSLFSPLISMGLEGRCDLIVSNPPYVAVGDWPDLPPETKLFEPRQALVAGRLGLEFIFKLVRGAGRFLRPGGYLILEIGFGQRERIEAFLLRKPGVEWFWRNDLSGITRVLAVRFASGLKS
ncbi:MAG: peptide chain release factor N(5)-glutamine methyltransferase [Candidatus Aminicenantales bacterium]